MSAFIHFESRKAVFDRISKFKEKSGLILILGKSGSGKSALLDELSKQENIIKITQIFKDKREFEAKIKPLLTQNYSMILLDEAGMYDEKILECVRIYSDTCIFVLSSHKFLKVFKKEHFKSRILMQFLLDKLEKNEFQNYVKLKHQLVFGSKQMSFLRKIYQGNLRNIDKILQSFKDLKGFYPQDKSVDYILKLSVLEHDLLR